MTSATLTEPEFMIKSRATCLAHSAWLHSTRQSSELGVQVNMQNQNKIHNIGQNTKTDESLNKADMTLYMIGIMHVFQMVQADSCISESRQLTWKMSVLSSILKDSQFLPLLAPLWSRDPQAEAGGVLKAACSNTCHVVDFQLTEALMLRLK